MKVRVGQIEGLHFDAKSEAGLGIEMDAGKVKKAPSPMEVVLMGLGGCSSVDVVEILKKQKLTVEEYHVDLEAERRTEELPAIFTKIHMHFVLKGGLPPAKVERAIVLSVEKYCSVVKMLEKTVEITHSYEII